MNQPNPERSRLLPLAFGALGVVYGDIGTSPLYALRECFSGAHAVPPTPANILGVLSMIFWSLILIVSVKYLALVMRASNKGEGGILALLALAFPQRRHAPRHRGRKIMIGLGVFGAALLYGDGMITPAISVLSAVEGLEIATPFFKPYIIPITLVVLVCLFGVQRAGTGSMGKIFGPITLIWFLVLAALGIRGLMRAPEVLSAVSPHYAVLYFLNHGWGGFTILGAVILVVTGAEALYADMGHFGRKPIQLAWFALVLPALLLNYFGQGALLLNNPAAAENPFYRLAPGWLLYPLVGLATFATVIASQALISGAFSLTMQAMQLGYSPRLQIDHTSSSERGQIYIPQVNWGLMIICILLVLGFGSSTNLAAAYGIAVAIAMLVTTLLFYAATQRLWKWKRWVSLLVCVPLGSLEMAYLGANLLKVVHGGWFPLAIGLAVYTLMATWKSGRKILGERLRATSLPFDLFLQDLDTNAPVRVSGTAVFLSGNTEGTPLALLHNLKHNKVLHKRVIVLTLTTLDVPHADPGERVSVEQHPHGFWRVLGQFGFMEDPSVPEILALCAEHGLEVNPQQSTFFLSRETIIPTKTPGMAIWREKLFALMSRNSISATAFFRIPANRVVELGMQVEL